MTICDNSTRLHCKRSVSISDSSGHGTTFSETVVKYPHRFILKQLVHATDKNIPFLYINQSSIYILQYDTLSDTMLTTSYTLALISSRDYFF